MTDPLAVSPTTWRGLPAWLIAGRRREAVVTAWGANLAAIRAVGQQLNPLWEPSWPAADPPTAARDLAPWGGAPEGAVLAPICGSNLCLPRFGGGDPSDPVPMHGDALQARWDRCPGEPAAFAATLPVSGLEVVRSLSITGTEVALTTRVRAPAGRTEVEWCEHTTLGGGFLDGCVCTAGADAAVTLPTPIDGSRFPGLAAGVDPEQLLAVPQAGDADCGDVGTLRMVDGWWAAENRRLGWRLHAAWDAAEFPWVAVWTQHHSRKLAPWHGRERTRGLEISTKPFPEGRPPAVRHPTWLGRRTDCIIPAGGEVVKTIRFTWEQVAG